MNIIKSMDYKVIFDQFPDYVCIQTEGEALPGDFENLLSKELESPKWKTDTNLLIDHRKLNLNTMTPDNILEVKKMVLKYSKKIGKGRCAFLVKDAVGFGIARMYELSGGDSLHGEIGVFYEFEEADNWLKAP